MWELQCHYWKQHVNQPRLCLLNADCNQSSVTLDFITNRINSIKMMILFFQRSPFWQPSELSPIFSISILCYKLIDLTDGKWTSGIFCWNFLREEEGQACKHLPVEAAKEIANSHWDCLLTRSLLLCLFLGCFLFVCLFSFTNLKLLISQTKLPGVPGLVGSWVLTAALPMKSQTKH